MNEKRKSDEMQPLEDRTGSEGEHKPDHKYEKLVEAVKKDREAEAQARAELPTHEELLNLLSEDPRKVLTVIGGMDLSQPSLQRFLDPDLFQFSPPEPTRPSQSPWAGNITEITVREWNTGKELRAYAFGDMQSLAQQIERTVLKPLKIPKGKDYGPYFVVMFVAFAFDNVRGPEFTELLNRVARVYANSIHRYYKPEHEMARRAFRQWLKNNLAKIFLCEPRNLANYPPLPDLGPFLLSPDKSPLLLLPFQLR